MKRASKEETSRTGREKQDKESKRDGEETHVYLHVFTPPFNSRFLSCCEIISVRNGTRVTRLGKLLSRFSNDVVNIVALLLENCFSGNLGHRPILSFFADSRRSYRRCCGNLRSSFSLGCIISCLCFPINIRHRN